MKRNTILFCIVLSFVFIFILVIISDRSNAIQIIAELFVNIVSILFAVFLFLVEKDYSEKDIKDSNKRRNLENLIKNKSDLIDDIINYQEKVFNKIELTENTEYTHHATLIISNKIRYNYYISSYMSHEISNLDRIILGIDGLNSSNIKRANPFESLIEEINRVFKEIETKI